MNTFEENNRDRIANLSTALAIDAELKKKLAENGIDLEELLENANKQPPQKSTTLPCKLVKAVFNRIFK